MSKNLSLVFYETYGPHLLETVALAHGKLCVQTYWCLRIVTVAMEIKFGIRPAYFVSETLKSLKFNKLVLYCIAALPIVLPASSNMYCGWKVNFVIIEHRDILFITSAPLNDSCSLWLRIGSVGHSHFFL